MVSPNRGNRIRRPTQRLAKVSRYMRRWLVERFFAWIQRGAGSSFAGSITPTISSDQANVSPLRVLESALDFEMSRPSFPVLGVGFVVVALDFVCSRFAKPRRAPNRAACALPVDHK